MTRIAHLAVTFALTAGLTASCAAGEEPKESTRSLSDLCVPWSDFIAKELHISDVQGGTRDPKYKMDEDGAGWRTCNFHGPDSWHMSAALFIDRSKGLPHAEREKERAANASLRTGQNYSLVDGYGYPIWVLDRRPGARDESEVEVDGYINDHVGGFSITQSAATPLTDEQLTKAIRFMISITEKLTS
ncbi:hypothetical protein ACTWPB_25235 [Nocardia sp. IBHARD005]|uniref:hypothetical protein n=1 Tax=Nocardia sp. IBHARD005 TaxID=3457765 RepID=UPI004059C8B1